MPTDQCHEPPTELSDDTRTFARVIASLQEEAEAIGWYEQRHVDRDERRSPPNHGARATRGVPPLIDGPRVPGAPQGEVRIALRSILFTDGDIVERAEQAEDEVEN